MSMHTRGPWKIALEDFNKPYIRIRGTVAGGCYKIANVIRPYPDASSEEDDETWANARLIAASPILLKALKSLKLALTHGDKIDFNRAVLECFEAIELAETAQKLHK